MIALLLLVVSVIAGEDDRCFLTGGGSTESFFVPEDLPVGSVLGHLGVIGIKIRVEEWNNQSHIR